MLIYNISPIPTQSTHPSHWWRRMSGLTKGFALKNLHEKITEEGNLSRVPKGALMVDNMGGMGIGMKEIARN